MTSQFLQRYLKRNSPNITLGVCFFGLVLSQGHRLQEQDWAIFYSVKQNIEPSVLGYINYGVTRYLTWSSRTFYEIVELLLVDHLIIFSIISAFALVLLAYSISVILKAEGLRAKWGICAAVLLLIPFEIYGSAGIFATLINGLWGFALGAYTLSVLVRTTRSDNVKSWQTGLAVFAAVLSANLEQAAVALFLFSLAFLVFHLFCAPPRSSCARPMSFPTSGRESTSTPLGECLDPRRKVGDDSGGVPQSDSGGVRGVDARRGVPLLHIAVVLISLIEMLLVLVCPGNKLRTAIETEKFFPFYDSMSFFNKLQLGSDTTIGFLFLGDSLILNALLVVIVLVAISRRSYIACGLLVFVKLTIVCINSVPVFDEMFLYVKCYNKFLNGPDCVSLGSFASRNNLGPIIVPAMMVLLIVVLVLAIYLTYGKTFRTVQVLGILGVGFCCRLMLMFSPTIFSSTNRTFLITIICEVVVVAIISIDLKRSFVL